MNHDDVYYKLSAKELKGFPHKDLYNFEMQLYIERKEKYDVIIEKIRSIKVNKDDSIAIEKEIKLANYKWRYLNESIKNLLEYKAESIGSLAEDGSRLTKYFTEIDDFIKLFELILKELKSEFTVYNIRFPFNIVKIEYKSTLRDIAHCRKHGILDDITNERLYTNQEDKKILDEIDKFMIVFKYEYDLMEKEMNKLIRIYSNKKMNIVLFFKYFMEYKKKKSKLYDYLRQYQCIMETID